MANLTSVEVLRKSGFSLTTGPRPCLQICNKSLRWLSVRFDNNLKHDRNEAESSNTDHTASSEVLTKEMTDIVMELRSHESDQPERMAFERIERDSNSILETEEAFDALKSFDFMADSI